MQNLFKVLITLLCFSSVSQAIDINILKPDYRCQSKEFIPDDNLLVMVLQDRVSGSSHIELAQSWIGGVRKTYLQVSEQVEKNGDGKAVIFEGAGIKLSIDHGTTASEQHPLPAVIAIPIGDGGVRIEPLICESLL